MKTAGRENPNRWGKVSSNRAPGAGGQNRSCSIQWAEKQENFQPSQGCFFLTSPFIELIGSYAREGRITKRRKQERLISCCGTAKHSENGTPANLGSWTLRPQRPLRRRPRRARG